MEIKTCAAQHFGAWACEPKWLQKALTAVQAGTWTPEAAKSKDSSNAQQKPYSLAGPGGDIAVISIADQITKGQSSFGGTSSVLVRRALRAASADPEVSAVLLHIDSPGGTVAGTGDLADDVTALSDGGVPVYAYIEDLGASAAYWVASQAQKVFANPTAQVGSIGVYAVLEDTTGAQEAAGIKFTTVSTGKFKGLGADGRVTETLVADVQEEIDAYNAHFMAAVQKGRGMSKDQVAAVADGRVFIADKAQSLGLIDEVASFDAAMTAISKEVMKMTKEQFSAVLAEHPDWIAGEREQAKKAGVADGHAAESARMRGLREACAGNDSLACDLFLAGKDAEDAKVTVAALSKASADYDATIKAQAAEIEKLRAQVGTQDAVGTSAAASDAEKSKNAPSDPKARAEKEWDEDSELQAKWEKKYYIKARVKELSQS